MKESIIFHKSFRDAINVLPEGEQLDAYKAIVNYGFDGTLPDKKKRSVYMLFLTVKSRIDADTGRPRGEKSVHGERQGGTGAEPDGNIGDDMPLTPPQDEQGGFSLFWAAWPEGHREGEQTAIKAWNLINPTPGMARKIIAEVEYRKETWEWIKEGGRYVPLPSKWLAGRRWEDEHTEAATPYPLDNEDGTQRTADWINWSALQ